MGAGRPFIMDNAEWIMQNETPITFVCSLLHSLLSILHSLRPTAAALTLCQRYRKHRASLLVFLHRTDVEPTNNVSERAVRPSVIHTKVSGGFRSAWGANAYAALCSVIDTARQRGTMAFAAVQALMGTPALPLPLPNPGE